MHDSDRADADLAERLGLRHDAADARFDIRTVIADENNERTLWPARIGKRVGFSVDALERKVTRFPAEVANTVLGHHESSQTGVVRAANDLRTVK